MSFLDKSWAAYQCHGFSSGVELVVFHEHDPISAKRHPGQALFSLARKAEWEADWLVTRDVVAAAAAATAGTNSSSDGTRLNNSGSSLDAPTRITGLRQQTS